MDMFLEYAKAFLVGGAICAVGQILVDKTKLTPARILTGYVVAGVILGAAGLYEPLKKWAGAGATVPIMGFGNLLAQGVKRAVGESGLLGVFTGAFTAAAGGICAAVFFACIVAIIFKPKEKK
jgi:stage V sporulation protein AE